MSRSDSDDELFVGLSARLREAHRRIAQLPVADDEKARAARRLLAITDASKHDLRRASARLEALLDDWDAGRIGAADGFAGDPAEGDQP